MVHSLDNIPESAKRDYFIYLLDYGWSEPIGDTLRNNFENMAYESATNNAVIIKGTVGSHFQNEVFSWHQINGLSGDEMLPALLISNMHPNYFRDHIYGDAWGKELLNQSETDGMKLILIPFRKFCKTSTEVIELIQRVFADIRDQKDISDFAIAKEMKKGKGMAVVDALILEPNVAGFGIDLKK
ncbi:MAG: hypothetical protein LWW93_16965 [Hyphomicrobiales bacterium]|nr:hypothetical protein [Hyphomicrobiales bacterium]